MPIAVLTAYTEKEYEPFDPYSRFYPAIPISVCFSNTALYTLNKAPVPVVIASRPRHRSRAAVGEATPHPPGRPWPIPVPPAGGTRRNDRDGSDGKAHGSPHTPRSPAGPGQERRSASAGSARARSSPITSASIAESGKGPHPSVRSPPPSIEGSGAEAPSASVRRGPAAPAAAPPGPLLSPHPGTVRPEDAG